MSSTANVERHLARAKAHIAKGDEYYAKAADDIIAAQKVDPQLSYRAIAQRVGKGETWCRDIVQWRTNPRGRETPYGAGAPNNERSDQAKARGALTDPEQRKQVLASLPAEQVEEIAQAATEVAIERVRAQRAEHQTEPTTSDLMGPEAFDPSEYWSDTLIIRINRNARELASLIKRAGGLLFGTMPPEEAFDYLHEAERLIAEARAAAQEIVRDKTEA